MSLISRSDLRSKTSPWSETELVRRLDELAAGQRGTARNYDIFLSHAFRDAVVVYGIYLILTSAGLTVFVDWIDRPNVDRTKVTPENAAYLRVAMDQSRTLLYAATENAGESRWMPWELGYMDGLKRYIGILPVVQSATSRNAYSGVEYLGLYPYVTAEYLSLPHPTVSLRRSAYDAPVGIKSWIQKGI
jgi:hypothetical protein